MTNTTKPEDTSNIKVEDISQPDTASVYVKIEPNVNSDDGTVLFSITFARGHKTYSNSYKW